MSGTTSITVRVPLAIRRRPGRKTVVMPVGDGGEAALPTRADPALVKALARAFRYQRLLDEGRYASISEMAAAERIERGYLGTLLRLTLLAPDVVEAILAGRQPDGLGLLRLMEPFPLNWPDQRTALAGDAEVEPAAMPHGCFGRKPDLWRQELLRKSPYRNGHMLKYPCRSRSDGCAKSWFLGGNGQPNASSYARPPWRAPTAPLRSARIGTSPGCCARLLPSRYGGDPPPRARARQP